MPVVAGRVKGAKDKAPRKQRAPTKYNLFMKEEMKKANVKGKSRDEIKQAFKKAAEAYRASK